MKGLDEKKKQIIVGVLVLVMLAIGGFQFVKGPPPPPPAEAKKDTKKEAAADEKPAVKNPQFVADLSERDPFDTPASEAKPAAPVPPAPKQVSEPVLPRPRVHHYAPRGLGGQFSPLPPPGLEAIGQSESFGYTVVGVINGDRSAAVLRDAQGNQRLVPVGQSIDGDSHVEKVDRDSVTINFRGKKLRLTTGGNPIVK